MKHGLRPTREQKRIIAKAGLVVDNWLAVKNLPGELHVVHRHSGEERVIKY